MKITLINKKFENIKYTNVKKQAENTRPFVVQNFAQVPSFAGIDVVLNNVNKIKKEMKEFPQDIQYRKQLLANSGLKESDYYKIRPIIGSEEIEKTMKEFHNTPYVYSTGEADSNLTNHIMRANLHMHTTASDGFLTPKILLDKAAQYADEVLKAHPEVKISPFTVAITDHDTTESAKEVIKIIANDPEKYKNLRVILGIEMTTSNNIAIDIVKNPTNTHTLVYGLDPNEPVFENFINQTKAKKFAIEDKMLKTANDVYQKYYGMKNFFNKEQSQEFAAPLKKGILGIHKDISRYLETKFGLENIALKDERLKKVLEENNLPTNTDDIMKSMEEFYYPIDHGNKSRKFSDSFPEYIAGKTKLTKEQVSQMLNEASAKQNYYSYKEELIKSIDEYKRTLSPKYDYLPTFENLYIATKAQKSVMVGLAHPLNTVKKIDNIEDKYKFLTKFYHSFKSVFKEKAKFSEAYYQSYSGTSQTLNLYTSTGKFMDMMSKLFDLFKTGSADSHRLNIFKRYY